ncbi:trace amine-associated receptor 13c-like isoform X1 [Cyprinodon tularosa]|uniref:trace amine-associated receptor 13c-like isoform X1 n=1 Tax=Cyprinodon tularosa TaxID=77115 RepID=UPI0018E23C78|nr:trace amine-associated receptor 13c-like isoform X1 [Cyprinodon tularosa]
MIMEETELCFPQFFNTSCSRPKRTYFETMITYILVFSISLLTSSLNLLVIISISHFRKLHSPTNLLLLSLAVCDFFIGLLMFFQILYINGCWLLGDSFCVISHFLAYVFTTASIGTMVMISIDRYVAICYPLHYNTKITQKKVQISVSLCWTWSMVFQSLNLMENFKQPGMYNSCLGECVIVINYISGLVDLILSFIVPIIIIVVLYLRIFVVAVSQIRAIHSHTAEITFHGSVNVKKSEIKVAGSLGVVVVVFLICLLPYFCVTLTGQDALLNASSTALVIFLFDFNSCLNPIIYTFFYSWFRKSIKLIITLRILQSDSCDMDIL